MLDWKPGFLFMLAGIALAMAIYFIFPGEYQAKATVVVDMNVEENWSGLPDNEIFYFLDRETRKLVEYAWSDEVMAQVTSASGISSSTLREDVLSLSQPKDGGWHFFAKNADKGVARNTATAWALAFTEGVNAEISDGNGLGILENITVIPSQIEGLPIEHTGSLSIYSLIGALGGWFAGMLTILFRKK